MTKKEVKQVEAEIATLEEKIKGAKDFEEMQALHKQKQALQKQIYQKTLSSPKVEL